MSDYLIFTSAGDNSLFPQGQWIKGLQNTDLIIYYYGDSETIYNKYLTYTPFVIKSKELKYQNLIKFYNDYEKLFNSYKYISVIDDDIKLTGNDFNIIFNLSNKLNLWISQPSCSILHNNISNHPITHTKKDNILRYCNFIEMGIPFFKKDILKKIILNFPQELQAVGIDLWYMQFIGTFKTDKYAIIDSIQYINPSLQEKGILVRECMKNQPGEDQWQIYERIARKYNLIPNFIIYFKNYYRQNMHKYNIIKKPLTSTTVTNIAVTNIAVTRLNYLEKEKVKELRTKRMNNLLTS